MLMSVGYAWTYLKQTQLLCVICTACEQPGLVCHGPQLSSFLRLSSGSLRLAPIIAMVDYINKFMKFDNPTSTYLIGHYYYRRIPRRNSKEC